MRCVIWKVLALVMFLSNLFCLAGHKEIMPESKAEIILKPDESKQSMIGFGASGSWWSQDVGGWSEDKIQKVVDLLYSREKGIGLNIHRYNIAAGKSEDVNDFWRTAETFEVEPGVYDWSKDSNAVNILKTVVDQGVDHVILCAYSPPARMTKSGAVLGHPEGKSNLKPDMYHDYAKYLVDITEHLIKDKKIPVKGLSPLNEPEWEWTPQKLQEGCHYKPEEIARLTEILLREISKRDMDIDVQVPECGHWKGLYTYLPVLFGNDYIKENIKNVPVHSYFGADFKQKEKVKKWFASKYPGKKLHMSEYCVWKWPNDPGMESAMDLANTIYQDIVAGGVVSWQWWLGVSRNEFCDGLVYVTDRESQIETTKRLWAFGNYSKFVGPGFKVFQAISDNEKLKVSAFRDSKSEKIVLVILNNSDKNTGADIMLENGNKFNKIQIFETSKEKDLENVYSGKLKKSHDFPPQSVTTIIMQK